MGIPIVILILVILFLAWVGSKRSKRAISHVGSDVSHPCSCGCSSPQTKSCQTWHPHERPTYFDDYPASSGFGLSSGEIQYQLPHPHDAYNEADSVRQMQIAMNKKAHHHKGGFELSCGDVTQQAAAWPAYVWQQPAPISNYFNKPYPEDTMSDGANMEYDPEGPSWNPNHGYNAPEYRAVELLMR